MDASMEYVGVLAPYARRMRLLAVLVLVGCAVGLASFFVMPKSYRSGALILPDVENSPLQAVGDLASLVGVNLGAAQDPSMVFPVLLTSDTVLKAVLEHELSADRTILQALGNDDDATPAKEDLDRLRDRLSVHRDQRTGVIYLSVLMPTPELASASASEFVRQLDDQVRTRRRNEAAVQRRFLDEQLAAALSDVEAAREALVDFRTENRSIDSSPALRQRESELDLEVVFREGLLVELRKQRELSRLYEERNVPVLSTLDVGRVPERPYRPRLGLSLAAGAVIGFFIGVAWIFATVTVLPLLVNRSGSR